MDQATRKKLEDVKRLMESAGTVGEAEAAAAAFQRLLLKHNLSAEDITTEQSNDYGVVYIRVAPDRKPGIQWRLNLLYVLTEYNFCSFIRHGHHGATGFVIGKKHNQEAVQEMFETMMTTIDRLAEDEWYKVRNSTNWFRIGSPTAMAWKNSFRLGFVTGLRIKMEIERKQELAQIEGASALVLVVDGELEKVKEEKLGKTGTHKGSRATNADGYTRGVQKGRAHELQHKLGS